MAQEFVVLARCLYQSTTQQPFPNSHMPLLVYSLERNNQEIQESPRGNLSGSPESQSGRTVVGGNPLAFSFFAFASCSSTQAFSLSKSASRVSNIEFAVNGFTSLWLGMLRGRNSGNKTLTYVGSLPREVFSFR